MADSVRRKIHSGLLSAELVFTNSRSGGPGGQNVNKVNSKVTVLFDVDNSRILTPDEKSVLREKLSSRMTRDGVLQITSQESRSQLENKDVALAKLDRVLEKAFERRKLRKATKPSKSARQERLKKKKVVSEKKQWRKRPDT